MASEGLDHLDVLTGFAAADHALIAALEAAQSYALLSGWRDIIAPPYLDDIYRRD